MKRVLFELTFDGTVSEANQAKVIEIIERVNKNALDKFTSEKVKFKKIEEEV